MHEVHVIKLVAELKKYKLINGLIGTTTLTILSMYIVLEDLLKYIYFSHCLQWKITPASPRSFFWETNFNENILPFFYISPSDSSVCHLYW